MIIRRRFYEAFSLPGSSAPPEIDIPTQPDGKLVIVTQIECSIRTANGRRLISAKDVYIDRYAAGIDGADRNQGNRRSNYRIPICGDRQKEVNYSRKNQPYTDVDGLASINRLGFRVCLDNKDRDSDEQWIRVAVESYITNELNRRLRS